MSKAQMSAMSERVNSALQTFLPEDGAYQEEILAAMRYSLLAGGKRLRPILVMASCEATGGVVDDVVLQVACALECVHTYSLVHDDLPGMDDDDLRRGQPTNHVKFGEAMAILAGDGLLTEAFTAIPQAVGDTALAAALMRELSIGAGFRGMVGGQAQDILCENKKIDEKTMKWIHAHKTGALILASCRMGGLLGNADEKMLDALSQYAESLGLAFQITDDILDVIGDEALLGKHTGSDERSQKATYPSLYGLEASRNLAAEAAMNAKAALKDLPGDTTFLAWLAEYIVTRQK